MDTKEIFEMLARNNNTTPEKNEEELRNAIRDAMKTEDPKAQMLWKRISPDGKEPTVDRFLHCVTDMLKERMRECLDHQ